MSVELEGNSVDNEEDIENDNDRISYLTSFTNRLLSAPLKKVNNRETVTVDVRITTEEIRIISLYASASFSAQNTLVRIDAESLPIFVVGDLHGQFHDLRMIFSRCGHPSTAHYLFLGDYVDRGMQGLETVLLLMAFQSLYPQNVFMVRGNHEDYNTTLTYGFYDECMMKYGKLGEMVWLHLINAFNYLPLSAIIVDKVLCMHGGISPNMNTLEDIDTISRPTFIPSHGLACDLVWSDPEASNHPGFALSARGISFSFDDTTIHNFCARNEIDLIIRAHQISSDMYRGGHKFHAGGRMITIFSAPNYLNMGNDSCIVKIDKNRVLKFIVFRPEKPVQGEGGRAKKKSKE